LQVLRQGLPREQTEGGARSRPLAT